MADWLMEIAERKRRSELVEEKTRPAPWEGRTRAELIYGGPVIDEPPSWSVNRPPVLWEPLADGSHKVTLREAAAPTAEGAAPATSLEPTPSSAATPSQPDTSAPTTSAPAGARPDSEATGQPPKKPAFDVDKAVEFLDKNALDESDGKCAKLVVNALVHAGANIPERTRHAKDYGDYLEWAGLDKIDKTNYVPQKGDVAVIQPHTKGESGHMQMWNSKIWESDFRQNPAFFYPGKEYRNRKPSYEIYRP